MKERAQESKTVARRGSRASKADGENEVLAKIAEMPEADQRQGELRRRRHVADRLRADEADRR